MFYALLGRLHGLFAGHRAERGQGTVEYVGLILLMAVVLAGVVVAAKGFTDDQGIAETVVKKLKEAVAGVGEEN